MGEHRPVVTRWVATVQRLIKISVYVCACAIWLTVSFLHIIQISLDMLLQLITLRRYESLIEMDVMHSNKADSS